MKKTNKNIFKQILLKNADFTKLRDLRADKVIKCVDGWGPSFKRGYFYVFGFGGDQINLIKELNSLGFEVYKWEAEKKQIRIINSRGFELPKTYAKTLKFKRVEA